MNKIIAFICFLVVLPALNAQQDHTSSQYSWRRQHNMGDIRFRVGAQRPHFNEDWKLYDALWGNTSWSPNIAVDWLPLKMWWIGIGPSLRFSYYTDKGFTLFSSDVENPQVDKEGESDFTMYSLELALVVHLSPFYERYVNLQAWIGWEYNYFTTVHRSGEESSDFLVASGKTSSLVYGVTLDLGLGFIDSRMMSSLRQMFGFDQVYLSAFLERTARFNQSEQNTTPLNRDVLGLGFTFETAH